MLAWTPDSKGFVISEREAPAEPNALYLVIIATGEKRRLTSPPAGFNGDSDPAFSPDGTILSFVRMRDLASQELCRLDLSPEFKPIGEPKALTDQMPFRFRHFFGHAWRADAREIIASVGHDSAVPDLWRVPIDDSRKSKRLESVGGGGNNPAVSPSARRLAYRVSKSIASSWIIEDSGASTSRRLPNGFLARRGWTICARSPPTEIELPSDHTVRTTLTSGSAKATAPTSSC